MYQIPVVERSKKRSEKTDTCIPWRRMDLVYMYYMSDNFRRRKPSVIFACMYSYLTHTCTTGGGFYTLIVM